MENGFNDADEEECIGIGSAKHSFTEKDEVLALIDNLHEVVCEQIKLEIAIERFTFIFDQYQEQPNLLDPHLETLINKLLTRAQDEKSSPDLQDCCFKFIYLITKVRGFKVVTRHLPHEVINLEPILKMIKTAESRPLAWETKYMLLVWLSIVAMIPFDMDRFDKGDTTAMIDCLYKIGLEALHYTDKSQDAASYFLAKFFTRKDVILSGKLDTFVDWFEQFVLATDKDKHPGSANLVGVLGCCAQLYKYGKRLDVLPFANRLLSHLAQANLLDAANTLLRKLTVKLTQRLGMTFLKTRIATWRYQRGSRSLSHHLGKSAEGSKKVVTFDQADDDGDDIIVPSEIEQVIEILLTALKDKDTVVRWSAAKGIGRITNRLPKSMGDDIVEALLELFSSRETDAAWHGGCLALAELGRRGLLLLERLPDVIPIISHSLVFDRRQGSYSVGSHVRDAACFVCWAFARAYDPTDVKSYVNDIGSNLVVTSLFDREVSVRKAASAAFQENVGRQGSFPHGIDILTIADYYSVSNRNHCYLELSKSIGAFPEYTKKMIDHLSKAKSSHWDEAVRLLASEALAILTPLKPEYVRDNILPLLISQCSGIDVFGRHGALVAVGQILLALSKLEIVIGENVVDFLCNIGGVLEKHGQLKGPGNELMRNGMSLLIEKCSIANMPLQDDGVVLRFWSDLLCGNLQHLDDSVRNTAVSVIFNFMQGYLFQNKAILNTMLGKLMQGTISPVETTRMGCCLALGELPMCVLVDFHERVVDRLTSASRVTSSVEKTFAESRRDALKALSSTFGKMVVSDVIPIAEEVLQQVLTSMVSGMNDYTKDHRGDVGSCVREVAMTGLSDLILHVNWKHSKLMKKSMVVTTFQLLAQQACERIDRTRCLAAETFCKLLHTSSLRYVPDKDELLEIFPPDVVKDWFIPQVTFDHFTQLLRFDTFSYHVLLGLLVSIGGITESLIQMASSALKEYLKTIQNDILKVSDFLSIFIQIFRDHLHDERVSLPAMKCLDHLFSLDCFALLSEQTDCEFALELQRLLKLELAKSGSPQKLLAAVDVYCGLLQFPGTPRQRAFSSLSILLCHKYPSVRKRTADRLYDTILTFPDLCSDEHVAGDVFEKISETDWLNDDVAELRPIRNDICNYLGIPVPVLKKKKPAIVVE